VEEYTVNVIAESLYSQVDDEGNQYLLMKEIIDHKKNAQALTKDGMWLQGTNGNKHMKRTTKGWKLWLDILGTLEGSQRITPPPSSQICCEQPTSRGTCFFMVGKGCIGEKESYYQCSQNQILDDDFGVRTQQSGQDTEGKVQDSLEQWMPS
jgi:hypothetical protein